MPVRFSDTIGGGTGGGPNPTDDFSLALLVPETNAAPTDAATEQIAGTFAEDIIQGTKPVFHNDTGNSSASSSSNINLGRPTATVDGDLLVAVINLSAASGALVITPPAGWTQLGSTHSVTDASLGITLTSAAYAKIAASEPTSWTWSWSPNANTRACDVMAFTGGKIPTDFSWLSNATQETFQQYGTVTSAVTGQELIVAIASLKRVAGQEGWSIAPTNLTNRTGDIVAAGANRAELQIWSGINGSGSGFVQKIEADIHTAFVIIAPPADNPATESTTLTFPAGNFDDPNTAPTDARSALLRVWLANSAGTDVSNPANANGANNGVNAVVQTAALASNPETLTSDIGVNVGAGLTFSALTYRGWFRARTTLVTSTAAVIAHSSTAAFADITMFTQSTLNGDTNHLGGTFTFDLLAAGVDTLAKLQSLQIFHRTTDAVAGVTPAILDVDAGAADIVATSI